MNIYKDDKVKVIDKKTNELLYEGKERNEKLSHKKWKYNYRKGYYTLRHNGYTLIKKKVK